MLEIVLRSLSFISSAALLVNVSRTTSLGRRPSQSWRLVLSEAGAVTIPPPMLGALAGFGRIRVALWSLAR